MTFQDRKILALLPAMRFPEFSCECTTLTIYATIIIPFITFHPYAVCAFAIGCSLIRQQGSATAPFYDLLKVIMDISSSLFKYFNKCIFAAK